ncbi:MAG: ATP-dependent helicase [Burkholderiaceae bacterium]|nr:MAG: ATP-dependent helicase [Burkholderiaceae bacterium]
MTKVVAYAGTGKTSSLCALAQRNRGMRGLYLAFTKSAETDARQRFPRSVQCKTVNALAMGVTGKPYLRKLGSLRPIDAIKLMGLSWDWTFAALVVDTVTAWCASDLEVFPDSAIAVGAAPIAPGHLLKYAAVVAGKLWQRMIDLDDPAPMTHDGYLKLFQLQHPTLPWDYVMLDEAQDTNPVTWDIVRRQKCPVVIVGDGYQSIFQFRGAINAMEQAQATRVLSLTQSFRFGPRIARIANALLWGFFTETTPLEGVGFDTVVRALPRDPPRHAVIARTNAEIFSEAVSAVKAGKSLGFAGGVNSYGFEKIIDTWRLVTGDTDSIRDAFLRNFKDFAALQDYAEKSRDLEVRRLLKIVTTYGSQIPDLIDAIHAACHPMLSEADVILSTAHRCKGLTLPVVRLAEDFPVLLDDRGNLLPPDKLDRQEVNLLYVAITRAQQWLMLNSTTLDFMRAMNLGDMAEEHALDVDATEDAAPSSWENDLPADDEPDQAVTPSDTVTKLPQFSQGDLFDLA